MMSSAESYIDVDGSVMEGGGQVLRMATIFSALLQKPIHVTKIRAGRSKPGLRPQHLSGLQLMRDISRGQLEGGFVDSDEIWFTPSQLKGGDFFVDTKTAGSTCLLMQISLPCLLFAGARSKLRLRGGTNADMAPQIDYLLQVFLPVIRKFGVTFECEIVKRGYYPKGGGEIVVEVAPVSNIGPVLLMDRGEVSSVYGRAWVAGTLPVKMAHAAADRARNVIQRELNNCSVEMDAEKETAAKAEHPGFGMTVVAETTTGCFFGGDSLGKRGEKNEEVGGKAANMLLDNLRHGGCVDDHLQDQLIVFMALAKGRSSVRTGPLTLHTETAIHIAQLLTTATFEVLKQEDGTLVISCEGIGLMKG